MIGLLIEPQAVSALDSDCIASGLDAYGLMQKAGYAAAASALRHFPEARRFTVLCGPGNNGGDGYVAARALAGSGANVQLFSLAEPATTDSQRAASEWRGPVQSLAAYAPEEGDCVVDALFGAGLSRDLSAEVAAVVEAVNQSGAPVLAIDMPSGVCGRSGQIRGAAMRATVTVTFVAAKPGQFLLPGRSHVGLLEIADIGAPSRIVARHASRIRINAPDIWQGAAPGRGAGSHKYSHGSLLVFSGGGLQTGAARLSALAGLRAGAGLVTTASPADAIAANAAHLTAVMLKQVDDREDLQDLLADLRLNAAVLGPGFGVGEKARAFALALSGRRLVLDADAITSFKDDPDTLFSAFAEGDTRLILTPHDGEFARLFPDLSADDRLSKVEKAQAAARRAHGAVILKGADTVIASPDGRAAINANAPPWLATAGSGDVLAGICGALLAQGYPAYEAACAAVWAHGEAGQRAGRGLTAETLINFIDI